MKKFTTLLMVSVISLGVSLTSLASTEMPLMFVQSAKSATIVPIKNQTNQYQLVLQNPDQYVSYFSDRPARVTGLVPTKTFLKNWNTGANSFKQNPPNAALETSRKRILLKNKNVTVTGELSNPHYINKSGDIAYDFKLLQPQQIQFQKAKLGYTTLFIDDEMVHWRPGGY